MICTTCFGKRKRLVIVLGEAFHKRLQLEPCPTCQGHGLLNCCDGLREQPREIRTVFDREEFEDDRESVDHQ